MSLCRLIHPPLGNYVDVFLGGEINVSVKESGKINGTAKLLLKMPDVLQRS